MYGCFEYIVKIFLGLIFICIMLVAAYKMVNDPYRPETKNIWSKPVETQYHKSDEGEHKSEQTQDEINYDVPLQSSGNHDYIMENTFQKSWVEMELTPELERGLVYVIKVFKAVFGQDFTPTIISAHDTFDKHDRWSRHRTGRAVDIGLNDLPLKPKRKVMRILQGTLPPKYKAIWENQYLSNEHLHFQSDH